MSWYTDGRAAWLQLEQMKAMKPSDDAACRRCAGATTNGEPLCDHCEDERLDLMQRFGGRAGSNNPRQRFGPKHAPREEWTPYTDR